MDIDTETTAVNQAATIVAGLNATEPDDFNVLSERFMTWLKSRPGVSINPNIALLDLRSKNAGRGVSTYPNHHFHPSLLTLQHHPSLYRPSNPRIPPLHPPPQQYPLCPHFPTHNPSHSRRNDKARPGKPLDGTRPRPPL